MRNIFKFPFELLWAVIDLIIKYLKTILKSDKK